MRKSTNKNSSKLSLLNKKNVNGKPTNAVALGIAFIIGTTGIILLRLLIDNRWSSLAAAILAVVIVICLGIYYVHNHIDDREQEGDNLYYLGLLFTLVSLVYALVVLFWLHDIDENLTNRTYELLGNFGVALLSTVAGILARIYVQNYQNEGRHRDPTEVDEEDWEQWGTDYTWDLRDGQGIGIGAAARALRRQLMMSTHAFRRYNDISRRMAYDTRLNLHRTVETSSREMQTKARATLDDFSNGYQQIFNEAKALHASIEKSAELLDETFKGFTNTMTKASSALEGVGQNLGGLTEIDHQAKSTAQTLSVHSGNLAKQLQEHTEIYKEEQEFTRKYFQDIRSARKSIHSEITEWKNQSRELIQEEVVLWSQQIKGVREMFFEAEKSMEHWVHLGSRVTEATDVLQSFEETQRRVSTLIQDIIEGFHQFVQESKEAQTVTEAGTATVRKDFEELTHTVSNLKPSLKRFGQTLDKHAEGLVRIDRQTTEIVDKMSQWNDQFKHMDEILEKAELNAERWTSLEDQAIATTKALKSLEDALRATSLSKPRRWWTLGEGNRNRGS